MAELKDFPASSLVGYSALVGSDVEAYHVLAKGKPVLALPDGSNESGAITPWFRMPAFTGTLSLDVNIFTDTVATGNVDLEAYVMAVTPGTDTIDMAATDSFDTVNAATHALAGTAGDPRRETITLTNNDSVAEGDLVCIGIRRDSDDATNDTAADLVYLSNITLKDSS